MSMKQSATEDLLPAEWALEAQDFSSQFTAQELSRAHTQIEGSFLVRGHESRLRTHHLGAVVLAVEGIAGGTTPAEIQDSLRQGIQS